MGESALLTGAVADPLASRLQRVFGVSQLRISPTFTTGTELPSAAVTLQQRVANNIMFTYASTLNNANAQTIAVEVTINPQWSAVATRDENGILSVNLLYKRQIR
jgi:translocation and assembly module TamB